PRGLLACAHRHSAAAARQLRDRPPEAVLHGPPVRDRDAVALMRQLYLAATGQNRGKTTASLGLLDGFLRRGLRAGFMKPVGQRTVIDQGEPADEDAVLMRATYRLPEPYSVLSPVHIPRGFTKAYIAGEVVEDLGAKIATAHARFA